MLSHISPLFKNRRSLFAEAPENGLRERRPSVCGGSGDSAAKIKLHIRYASFY
jgi:hypothetical protein